MPKKKVKDLDPKSRSKKIKGGSLSQDVEHVNRDAKRITDAAVTPIKNTGKALRGGA